MELRWLIRGGDEYETWAGRVRKTAVERVLQYRDGVTHDAPWLDVPEVKYEPAEPEAERA